MWECHYSLGNTKCTLTGRICLCEDNPEHCLRRINADAYAAKHPDWLRPRAAGLDGQAARLIAQQIEL